MATVERRLTTYACLLATSFCFQGCAIHHYDARTGTEHVWGFGHMKMKVTAPSEGVQAVVRCNETFGVAGGWVSDHPSILVGWDKQARMDIIDPDTSIRLEWPDGSLFNVRIGTNFPPQFPVSGINQPSSNQTEDFP